MSPNFRRRPACFFLSQIPLGGVYQVEEQKIIYSRGNSLMSKKVQMLLGAVTCLAVVVFLGSYNVNQAQGVVTGDWTASLNEDSKKIHLSFERRSEKSGKHQMGKTYDFSELQGLTREQVVSGGLAQFSLVREAGRIDCEGSFQNGRGSGTFRFTGNPGFITAMKSRGFDFEKSDRKGNELEERLFAATTLNVTLALADDLISSGFANLDVEDLFKAAIFKIDSNFMREMKASGFPNMGMEELVKARIFKIDAAFVARVTQMGFDKEPFESLVKMQIFKITPDFLNEIRNEGLTDLSIEQLVKLKIFKIDSEFIRQARAEGVPLEVEKLVERRIGIRTKS